MDDTFLHEARRDPSPQFAERLHRDLKRQGPASRGLPGPAGLRATLLVASCAAAGCALFLFPSVRASAQAFLDLFRVRTFTAVSIDPERLAQLEKGNIDFKDLVSRQVETLESPGSPEVFATPEAAGAAAGIAVRIPAELPAGVTADSVRVQGRGVFRLTVDTATLQSAMNALGITDIQLPAGLNGTTATLRVHPAVQLRYAGDGRELVLIQGRSPEMTLPQGLDLPRLAEIGLRIIGADATDARRLAGSVDWHSTLLVPVPANASSFSEVTVRGNRGLLITTTGQTAGPHGRHREGGVVLWSEAGMVYALLGDRQAQDLVEIADSVR